MTKPQIEGEKKIMMFEDGMWVKWDGSDVERLIVTETISKEDAVKYFNYPDDP